MAKFEEPLDENGMLSEASLARINDALRGKFKQPCASCGERQFAITERIYCAPAMGRDRSIDFGNTFPMVMVQCTHCGHVVTFAARLVGLYQEVKE